MTQRSLLVVDVQNDFIPVARCRFQMAMRSSRRYAR